MGAASACTREPELLGQTVVVIGGSAGIGLETARRGRAEGAEVILTGRNPERLEQAAREVGATSTAAFDASDLEALDALLRGPAGPDRPRDGDGRRPLLRAAGRHRHRGGEPLDSTITSRRAVRSPSHAVGRVRPGGTLLFIGGTGGRTPASAWA